MGSTGTSIAAMTSQQVRMANAPLATVTELTIEALGRPKGSPSSWPRAVRQALEPRDLAILGPVYGAGGPPFVPDCLLPRPETSITSFGEEVEQVAGVSADQLVAELHTEGQLGSTWSTVARAPRRWLDGYVLALRRAWSALSPRWEQAMPVIEREIERLRVALAEGTFDQVLGGLHPNGRVEHDRWYLACWDSSVTIAAELLLVPMLIGPKASLLITTSDEVSYLGYPLRGAHRLLRRGRPYDTPALEALVGGPRAQILRQLDRETPAGHLAADLQLAPSAITHHLTTLESAGLITREPVGQHVLVHRTTRGTSLLHLYER